MSANNSQSSKSQRKQQTISRPVSFAGIGVHSGKEVTMQFRPAPAGTGIVFKRIDLPHQPLIPANVDYVCDTSRSTTIGVANQYIHTIEHVLAAIRAYEVDNLYIDVSSVEPPISDGSSSTFVDMIEKAEVVAQETTVAIMKLKTPLYWSEGDIHLVALPYDGYKISYTLNYPDSNILKAQFCSLDINSKNFKEELSTCRTFSRYDEVATLMDRGLIKGGSLDNAVIIHDDVTFSKGGLQFPDEMVRHKILDMIGDLALVGIPFEAHIIAIRSGHASNYQLAKKISHHIKTETVNAR